MVKRIERQIIEQYPDYVELSNLMSLARLTNPYGLGVMELSNLDRYQRELVYIYAMSI